MKHIVHNARRIAVALAALGMVAGTLFVALLTWLTFLALKPTFRQSRPSSPLARMLAMPTAVPAPPDAAPLPSS